jgi:molybdopterin adenylyltransferase
VIRPDADGGGLTPGTYDEAVTAHATHRGPDRVASNIGLARGSDPNQRMVPRVVLGSVIMAMNARILVVSDSVAGGRSEDRGGPAVEQSLREAGYDVDARRVVPDGIETVAQALREMSDGFAGLLVTTGGTGFSPRDLTPEATNTVLDREAPGLAEAMRLTNPLGRLSRAGAGTRGQTLIINLPGSPGGAIECLGAVLDVIPHALELLSGAQPHRSPGDAASV